jgi:hypothetical protein
MINKIVAQISVISGACLFTLISASVAKAAQFVIPNTIVQGTDVFSGPSFTLDQNYLASDTLNITVSGTVDLANGRFTSNAAGIIIAPTITNTGNQPGQIAIDASSNRPFASLLIGNNTLGFFPLFQATAANGLGSSAPATTLSLVNASLSSIFTNPGFVGLTSGTTLELRVDDINTGDNRGSYSIISNRSVPEPSSVIGLLAVGALATVSTLKRPRKQEI